MSAPKRGILPSSPGGDIFLADALRLDNDKGAVMPGSHADDIVGEFFESDDWGELGGDDAASDEPDLDLPPLPPGPDAA